MKRKLLFAALCACAWVSSYAVVWTDKTSLITNPSFETDAAISDLTKGGSDTKVAPTGWTVTYDTGSSNANTQQWGTADASSKIQGIGSSHEPSDGKKYYYIRENWHGSTIYSVSQTISAGSIPAGLYRLSVKLANFGSSATDYALSIQEEGKTEVKTFDKTTGSSTWQDWSIIAYKASDETSLTIKASMKGGSAGSSHWCLLLDDFKLEYMAPSSVSSTNTVDITPCIVNPSFELNTYTGTKDAASSIEQNAGGHKYATGWTFLIKQTGWSNVANVTDAPADGSQAFETWAGTPIEFKVYQTLSTLPEGVYEISASARTQNNDANDICTYATVGGGEPVYSDPFDVSNIQTPWNGSTNWQTLTARFNIIGSAAPEVGIHSTKFMQFDNFHLTYLGSDLLLDGLKSDFATLQTTATSDLASDTYTNVTGSERSALTSANATPEEETVDAWTTAITALTNAISAFEAAKTNYDALAAEIVKAKALGIATATADGYAATSSTTTASALTSTQNLKVEEYNYVTSNYQYSVALGKWTSTGTNTKAATFNNQHWSGTDYDYMNQDDSNGQGWNASAWEINFNQDVSLPAGNYVFKVAGRQASGDQVNTSLVVKLGEDVLGTVNDFPRSNNSRGINKSGETAFAGEDSEFANDGKGYGWEWRYVKFTLDSDATVNIAINSIATAQYQWVSFGDYTLQTNDALNGYKIAFNVAKRDAQAVDQNQKMNATVKSDLQTALTVDVATLTDADTYTAATNALTTATANAIASIAAYAEVKAAIDEADAVASILTGSTLDISSQKTAYNNGTMLDSEKDETIAAIKAAVKTALFAQTLPASITTMMKNPSFEASTWDEGWTVSRNTTGTWDYKKVTGETADDGILDGETALNAWAQQINYINVNQKVTLPKGYYRLTAAVFSDKIKSQHIYARYESTNFESPTLDGTVWQTLSVDFTVANDNTEVTLGVYSQGNNVSGDSFGWFKADNFQLFYLGDAAANMKIAAGKYGTFIAPFEVTIPEGVTASTVTGVDGSILTLEEVETTIPANTPVVVTRDDNAAVDEIFYGRSTATKDSYTEGLLTGVYTEAAIPAGSYVLQTPASGQQGFYKVGEGFTATPNKCYLTVPASSGVKAFFFSDSETGIKSIANGESVKGQWYNLSGQRVNKAQKGIYIINGKKVVK